MHTSFPIITGSAVVALFLGIMGGACRHDLPNHCSNLEGDATCRENGQGEFCSVCVLDNDGCGDVRPGVDCYFPGESTGESSGSGSSGTGSTMDTSSESSVEPSTDSGTATTTGGPCLADGDCTDAAAPYCDPAGACVSCEEMADPDGACAGTDPGNPLCVGGGCVACTRGNTAVCDDELLLCDEGTNACVPCDEHQQCDSGACELAMGRCFPGDVVVHVDADGGQDFMSVIAAVGSVGDGMHGVIVVHEVGFDGLTPYTGLVQVDGGKTIAMLAAAGEAPILQGTGADPGMRVEGVGTVLYVDGLIASDSSVQGVVVDGTTVWVDRSRIVENSGGGVLAQNGAELVMRNCFVGGNVEANVLDIQGSSAEVLYSSLGAGLGATTAVTCDGGSTVSVRSSVVISRGDPEEIQCTNISMEYSATDLDQGGTNTSVGMVNTAWFNDYNGGDFSLTTVGPTPGSAVFVDLAQWQEGDPPTDIEGDARPTIDGTSDYAGADIP